eukprot:jgi/Psemu1/28589/gm1.28589_g
MEVRRLWGSTVLKRACRFIYFKNKTELSRRTRSNTTANNVLILKQEPPQVRLHDRELMVVPPDGTMKNWSPLMPLPVLVAKKEKQQAQLSISPMLPPKIQRLTLDDAPAFPRYPRHHHYNDRTKTTPTNIATPQGVLYDIDGLPMDIFIGWKKVVIINVNRATYILNQILIIKNEEW